MLYFGCWQPAGVVGLLGPSRGHLLPINNQWVRAFIDRVGERGAACRKSTDSSERHLETGHLWSDQHHVKYCSFSVPGSVWPHFFEAKSQNRGSSCHGCSLVIMPLTSSTCWGFQYLSDHSKDAAQVYL